MAEPTQFTFTHKELVEALIKKADLHDGKWMLLITFGFGAINTGPGPDQVLPTALASVQHVSIQKAPDDAPPSLVADAAQVNPIDSKARSKKS
jgi:hypothetical protein